MAVCEKALKHYARMRTLLAQFVAEKDPRVTADTRALANETLRAVRGFVDEVKVDASEPQATVLVDGEEVGKTPLAAPVPVDLGAHTIDVKKEGFLPLTTRVEASGGESRVVDAKLVPVARAGRLVVDSDTGAAIRIDTDITAVTRWSGTLPAGSHHVKITAPGRKTYEAQLEVVAGSTSTVNASLEKEGFPLWAIVGGGVVLAAGLTVGGYFLFKPADKPGSQTQGSLGTVTAGAGTWVWK
jgi:hypothetical protein